MTKSHRHHPVKFRLLCAVLRRDKTVRINEDIELRLLGPEYSEAFFSAVDQNRQFLREWLPWVDSTISVKDTENFLRAAAAQYESGKGPQYAIFYQSTLCGVCGFHPIEPGRQIASIGYWLTEATTGKGIITRVVQELITRGFADYGLEKIEISCATENHRSRAIPERLGFKLDGIAQHQERLYSGYVDHAIYSILAAEWAVDRNYKHSESEQ